MASWIIAHLQFISLIVSILGFIWAIITYINGQREKLSLERTKFIFDQSSYFDSDASMRVATEIVMGLSKDFSIEKFLKVMKCKSGNKDEIEAAMAFERYLSFLWRVSYANLILKTIKDEDVDAFGYYIYLINAHDKLREYCQNDGFEEIIQMAKRLECRWERDARRARALS